MCRHALKLRHLQCFFNGGKVRLLFVKREFSKIISSMELQFWVKSKSGKGAWYLESKGQTHKAVSQSGDAVSGSSTMELY